MSPCRQLNGVCENCQANANLPSFVRRLHCVSLGFFAGCNSIAGGALRCKG